MFSGGLVRRRNVRFWVRRQPTSYTRAGVRPHQSFRHLRTSKSSSAMTESFSLDAEGVDTAEPSSDNPSPRRLQARRSNDMLRNPLCEDVISEQGAPMLIYELLLSTCTPRPLLFPCYVFRKGRQNYWQPREQPTTTVRAREGQEREGEEGGRERRRTKICACLQPPLWLLVTVVMP